MTRNKLQLDEVKIIFDDQVDRSQLKKINSIIPLEDKILFKNPSDFSKPIAKIKEGRLLIVQKCEDKWCKVKTKKIKGWIKIDNVWGLVN